MLQRAPSNIPFGNKQVNTTSFVQTVSVSNTGDAPLVVGVIAKTGMDPGQFVISGDGCSGATLETTFPNSCSFDVTFAPTSTGAKSATVEIPSNGTNGTQAVALTGNGVNPQATVSPGTVPFGNKQVNTVSFVQTIFVQNTGSGSGPITVSSITKTGTHTDQFAIGNDGCTGATLEPTFPNSCSFDVTFEPTSTGAKSATLNVNTADPITRTVTLSGNGVNPQTTVSPGTVPFGNKQVNTVSFVQTIFVQNTGSGSGPITVSSITKTGTHTDQFVIGNDGCTGATLEPTFPNSCSFDVTFEPTSTGAKSATLNVNTNDPITRTVTLSGNGVNPQMSVSPTNIPFGEAGIGTTSSLHTVFVQNSGSGNGPITIGTISKGGANADQFVISNDGCTGTTLEPTFPNSCSFDVAFAPTIGGVKSALVTVPSNDPVTRTVSLSGTGVTPFTVSPASISFGIVQIGTSPVRTITITSNSDSPISFGSASIFGATDFAIVEDNCATVLLTFNGDFCRVDVTFSPQGLGAKAATLGLTSDAGAASVPLSGNGIDTIGPSCTWTTTSNSIRVSLLQSVNGHCSDPSGVASASVTFTDMLGSPMPQTAILSNCTAGNKECDFSVVVPLMLPGLNTAQSKASDTIGNLSTGPTITLIVI